MNQGPLVIRETGPGYSTGVGLRVVIACAAWLLAGWAPLGCAERVVSEIGDGEEGGEGESGLPEPEDPQPDLPEPSESDSGVDAECSVDEDCPDGKACFEGTCLNQGMLRISLAWDADVDFDLHVRTPLGSEIFYLNTVADGGYLDVDDCVANACAQPNGTHVENVYFQSFPPPGSYEVWVVNYNGTLAGSVTVEVSGDAEQLWSEHLELGIGSTTTIWSFSV